MRAGCANRPAAATPSAARPAASSPTSRASPRAGARSSRAPPTFGLVRNNRVPWEGRQEDKSDDSVWAVTCVFVRPGFRRRDLGYALARAAVDVARRRGARALEAYPIVVPDGQKNTLDEIHVGNPSVLAAAGLTEVNRPTLRRLVMRIDF